MSKRILNRREFLRTAATAAATVVAAASGATTILASNGAWAMELKALPAHEAEVLLAMTRRLYPHEMLATSTTPRWSRRSTPRCRPTPIWRVR